MIEENCVEHNNFIRDICINESANQREYILEIMVNNYE